MARKRRNKGSGSVMQRGRYWYIRYYIGGERQEETTKQEDRAEAERLLAVKIGEVAAGVRIRDRGVKKTVADALQLVVDDYQAQDRASLEHCQRRINLHISPAIGHIQLADVAASDLRAYVKVRRRKAAAPASINRELAIIRRGFVLAAQESPRWMEWAPKVEMLQEDNVRQGFVEQAQYDAVRAKLPDYAQLPLVIGYHTGLRRNSVLGIRLDQVDWTNMVIRLTEKQVKNRQAHVVPIYGDMVPYVDMARSANVKYLCERNGKRVRSIRGVWTAAVEAADLPDLLFHDLRRSAVRNMIRAGIPEKLAMSIAGMKTRSIIERYNIISEDDVRKGSRKMASYLDTQRLGEELGEGLLKTNHEPVM